MTDHATLSLGFMERLVRHADSGYGRVTTEFDGRQYPPRGGERPIPSSFKSIMEDIYNQSPFAREWKGDKKTKETIFQAYHETSRYMKELYEETLSFISRVYVCNTEIKTEWKASQRISALLAAKKEEMMSAFHGFKFVPKTGVMTVDLHSRDLLSIIHVLELSVRYGCEKFVADLANLLDVGVDVELIGLLEWVSSTSGRFHYFIHAMQEKIKDQKLITSQPINRFTASGTIERKETTTTERTEVSLEQNHQVVRCVHELVNMKKGKLPVEKVPMPDRVKTLLVSAPSWIFSSMRIITGTEIRRLRIAEDRKTLVVQDSHEENKTVIEETERYNDDPAIALGFYVLTGWGDEETRNV